MNIFSILIFCIVLLFYLHVHYHLKTANDREIYQVGNISKDRLEEICNIRQPTVFNYINQNVLAKSRKIFTDLSDQNKSRILNIYKTNHVDVNTYTPINFDNTKKLFRDDTSSGYYTRNNKDFLLKCGLNDVFENTNDFLKPSLCSREFHDMYLGSELSNSVLQYNISYRNYLSIVAGSATIKVASPNKSVYLDEIRDYHQFMFYSNKNIWNINMIDKQNIEKVQVMDIKLTAGQTLFIPPYWWYTIQFHKDTIITSHRYNTFMNEVAILPRLIKGFIQSHNIKHKPSQIVKEEDNVLLFKEKNVKIKKNKKKKRNKSMVEKTRNDTKGEK